MKAHNAIIAVVLVGLGVTVAGFKPAADAKPKNETKAKKLTFAHDIAPIIYKRCSGCHHAGEAAPFSLMTYQDVAKRADLIAQVTARRVMPPWQPVKADCPLANDESLTQDQVDAIQAWAKAGAPKGSNAPKPPVYKAGWKLGQPDLVVTMPKAYNLVADGPDVYRNFTVPLHLDHDVWVKAVAFKPGNLKIVHHCLFFFDASGTAIKLEGEGGQPGFDGLMPTRAMPRTAILSAFDSGNAKSSPKFGSLGGWAVGAQPDKIPADFAYYLPKGSDLILSTHFHPSGKPESEQSSVGLYFTNVTPSKEFASVLLPVLFGAASGINIPPGAKDYTIKDEFTLPVNTTLMSVGAHAHYLGKHMDLYADYPDGKTKHIFSIRDWNFNWQGGYTFAPFVKLPAGTKLRSIITYDNTAENPRNPANPPKWVYWGEQTKDEMGSVGLRAFTDSEADLAKLKAVYVQHIRDSFRRGR